MILPLTKRRLRPITFLIISALLLAGLGTARAEQLRVVTQNSLNYGGQSDRLPAFRTIMRNIGPDLACMQEITNSSAVSQLLSQVFLQINDDWAAVPFHDGPDTDNAFFYRTSKVQLVSTRYIQTTLRDIAEYTLRPASGDTTLRVRVYSLHLKANSGSGDNVERRRQEALVLRQQLDQTPAGSLLMVCGDYNIISSDEPAYQLLLAATPSTNGQLFDPINTPGHWDGNATFAAVHTIGTDGLNARFDFVLVSNAMMDTIGSHVLPDTYRAYGNDGLHFGRAVNALPNHAVPDSVANALYAASDHLPVVTDFILNSEVTRLTERPSITASFTLMTCYPNPFNSALNIAIAGLHEHATLLVTDVLGRRVFAQQIAADGASSSISANFSPQSTGIYFVVLRAAHVSETQRVAFVR
jgi:endonuclease/exonuclease/phosphatase family metal-dependent hydrolase